jgi:hypothetical protein
VPFVVIAAILTLIVVGIYFGWKAQQARLAAMQALADELGLRFLRGDDDEHDERYAQFAIFRRGHSRAAENSLTGSLELFGRACHVHAGDFRYEEDKSDRKGTTTYRFSYLIVHPPWPSPSLLVRREGLFDKLKGAFGFDDIDFESAEFSRKYFVQSSDKRFAYDVLHPRMMEFLLAEDPLVIDIEGGALCISDGRNRWEPDDYRRQIDFVRRFSELWPRHLVKDLEN